MKLTQTPVLFYFLLGLSLALLGLSTLLMFMRSHNQSISHPLPVSYDEDLGLSKNEESPKPQQALHIVANHELKQPLSDILSKFKHHNPHITTTVNYVNNSQISSYLSENTETHLVLTDAPTMERIEDSFKANSSNSAKPDSTDSSLSEKNITPPFDFAMSKSNSSNEGSQVKFQGYVLESIEDTAAQDNKGSSATIIFRRFLLSSNVQKMLKSSELESIETYQNSVDDLFNTSANSDVDVSVEEMLE